VSEPLRPLPFASRFYLAWSLIFSLLFDGLLAARVARAVSSPAELPPATPPEPKPAPVETKPAPVEVKPAPPTPEPALQLLALFQREGRLIDFLEQDLKGFSDAEISAVARVVHDGCQRALHGHAKVAPIRAEDEGASVTIAEGYSPAEIKLSGNVTGSAPYRGKVQHRGWRATDLTLPTPVAGHDASVLAPAEIEL
jgi:hypothetical protein